MGKSAKLHKRSAKKLITSQPLVASSKPVPLPVSGPTAKRKSNLKAKGISNPRTKGGNGNTNGDKVLGDVDYVALMMGGRKKAQAEANKMTVD